VDTGWGDDPLRAIVPIEQLALGKYQLPSYDSARARLDANEGPYPLDADIAAELGAVLARATLNRYPDPETPELRQLLSTDLGVAPDQLVFGNGSYQLMMFIISAFSRAREAHADGRPRVLFPAPTFIGYSFASAVIGAQSVRVPLTSEFELDRAALDHAFATARPNVAFFALPNNPTGTQWSRAEIERLLVAHRDVVIVADEAYVEYSGETLLDALPRHPNLLLLRTLSKLGLAGLRIGFAVGAPALVAHIDKIRPPFDCGTLNQVAAAWLLTHARSRLRSRVDEVVRERERLSRELAQIPHLRVFPSRANYVLCRYGEASSGWATKLCTRLEAQGVLVHNFDAPGPLAGCFRATVGTPAENSLFLDAARAFAP